MAKNTGLDGGTVQKSKIVENNQCRWAVEEEVVFILQRDMAWSVFSFRKISLATMWRIHYLKVKVLEAVRVLGDRM